MINPFKRKAPTKPAPPEDDAKIFHAAESPSGVVPRNLQTFILVGLAAVMILVIAFSGSRTPPARKAVADPPPSTVPSQTEIREFQRGIEEHTRRLQLEQAELARAKDQALAPPFGPNLERAAPMAAYPGFDPAPFERRDTGGGNRPRNESLFASNIALSLRTVTPASARPPAQSGNDSLPFGVSFESEGTGDEGAHSKAAADDGEGSQSDDGGVPQAALAEAVDKKNKPSHTDINRHAGKSYRLFEGTVLDGVLLNRLDGGFSGPVQAMLTNNVYSQNRQRLLIPQGSRLLGQVKPVQAFGQQRLAVTFHRLIMPDGYNVDLTQFLGLNQIGETGLRDRVDNHYLQLFGVSIAIGALSGLSQAGTRYGSDASGLDVYRQGVSSSLSQSSLRILDRYLNVLPTITIREGHRLKVLLADDLLLPDYDNHRMPGDL